MSGPVATFRDDPVGAFLAERPLMILDGALATELERRGADLNDPLWSARVLIDSPELIRATHRDYFEAGADLATTASYQATFEGFARRGIDAGSAAALMRRSVELALAARDEFWSATADRAGRRRPLIAASIGPYGAMLADGSEYRGYDLSVEFLMNFHRPRMQVMADSGADLLAFETIPCRNEAVALARLLREFPGRVAWISFSCSDGEHVSDGESVEACVDELADFAQIAAVGVNCVAPQFAAALVARIRGRTLKPIAVYPNSGERYDAAGKRWHGCADPAGFLAAARRWHAAGARLIGGCCRTTPADIRALRDGLPAPASSPCP